MDNISQFRPPQGKVVQAQPNPWSNLLPSLTASLTSAFLQQQLSRLGEGAALDRKLQLAGFEPVPEGTPPDPTRPTRTIKGRTFYLPLQNVFSLDPRTGQLAQAGTVPEGSVIRELPQQAKVKTVLWRNLTSGQYLQLPEGDSRSGELLKNGFLPFDASVAEQKLQVQAANAAATRLTEQQRADVAAFQARENRGPSPQEYADILRGSMAPGGSMGEVSPEMERISKKLVAAEIPYPSSFALKSPFWQGVISTAENLDPGFNASTYQVRSKVRQSYTSGRDKDNINALNQAIGHAAELEKAGTALDNTSWRAFNSVANLFESEVRGDPRVDKFKTAAQAVGDELERVFRGTGGNLETIKEWRARLNASNSPEQMEGVLDTAYQLLFSRLETMLNTYHSAMGDQGSDFRILSPKARKILVGRFGEDFVGAMEPPPETEAKKANSPKTEKSLDASLYQRGW